MKNNIRTNYIYSVVYQILSIILPLVSAPYVSRVLGAEGIGVVSYTRAITQYFSLFALLGVVNYGNRTIAIVREDKAELSKTFWSIYFLQLTTSLILIFLYFCYLPLSEFPKLTLINAFFIFSSAIDISWFFFGLEEFKLTVTRNIFVRFLSFVLIFVFVKKKDDFVIYATINALSTFFSQVFLWISVFKRVKFVKVKVKDIIVHIKPNLILFIPIIAISLYKYMDKIMLGMIMNTKQVGFYENAEKIVNIPMGVITALGNVMMPKMSNLFSKNKTEKADEYINKCMLFSTFLAVLIFLLLVSFGKDFSLIYFGDEFEETGRILQVLAFSIPLISVANVVRTQYLIPAHKDKYYIISVVCGALVNLLLNLMLIPSYGAFGAAIGTVVAEGSVTTIQVFFTRKKIRYGFCLNKGFPILLALLFGICIELLMKHCLTEGILQMLLNAFLTASVYCLVCFVLFKNKSRR